MPVFKLVLPFALLASSAVAGTEPVTDEVLRTQALAAVFPGMQVAVVAGKAIDATWRPKNLSKNALTFPDVLALEKVYRVSGKPANEVERCAAAKSGGTREARFRLYMWPGASTPGADWLGIVQYKFTGVTPDFQCLSVPLLVHLKRTGAEWRITERFLLDTHGHVGIEGIQLVDLTGDGREELVVDSDAGEEE